MNIHCLQMITNFISILEVGNFYNFITYHFFRCVPIGNCATDFSSLLFKPTNASCLEDYDKICCNEEDIKDTTNEVEVSDSDVDTFGDESTDEKSCSSLSGHRSIFILNNNTTLLTKT